MQILKVMNAVTLHPARLQAVAIWISVLSVSDSQLAAQVQLPLAQVR